MFDEGENHVTIHLPKSTKRVNEEMKSVKSTNLDTSKKVNPIRDYSIDTINGLTGLPYWKYDEENRDGPKYVLYITYPIRWN